MRELFGVKWERYRFLSDLDRWGISYEEFAQDALVNTSLLELWIDAKYEFDRFALDRIRAVYEKHKQAEEDFQESHLKFKGTDWNGTRPENKEFAATREKPPMPPMTAAERRRWGLDDDFKDEGSSEARDGLQL